MHARGHCHLRIFSLYHLESALVSLDIKIFGHEHQHQLCDGVRHLKAQYSAAKLSDLRLRGGLR